MNIHKIYGLGKGFRANRMKVFLNTFDLKPETTILDVGGFSGFWRNAGVPCKVTILRPEGPEPLPADCPANITSVQGDGCAMPEYAEKSFDIVFSNSVIEHVGESTDQQRFATETLRVGKGYWMQTPAFEFPIEPHLLTPFYHWMPRSWQDRLFPWTIWGLMGKTRPTMEDFRAHARAVLLSRNDVQKLYPGGNIITERFFGLPKSYVSFRVP